MLLSPSSGTHRLVVLTWALISDTIHARLPPLLNVRSISTLPSSFISKAPTSSFAVCQGGVSLQPVSNLVGSRTLHTDKPTTVSATTSSQSTVAPWKEMHSQIIRRIDYKPSPFTIPSIDLSFLLDEEATIVTSQLACRRQSETTQDLVLNGENLSLLEVKLDGRKLQIKTDYSLEEEGKLRIFADRLPREMNDLFTVETVVQISPKENLQLSGLYASNRLLCTQCEAQGFRRITYSLDRPDVMSKFKVKLTASKQKYPILLSNGNKVEHGDEEDGSAHYAVYEDHLKKPSYLFALVGGNLRHIDSTFITHSGKTVQLRIFSEPENIDKLHWAMDSLKKAMKWDEDVFGLEYDLDEFNIVAVNDFNMGAMENKGLNIFNTACLLASPETTTDSAYERVRTVVAHEYFHNWTGNRVTCRDWFQLTLKEGLTVFRDQLFSQTVGSFAVERINQIKQLRSFQFIEDSSPTSHPIRPDSYTAIENFYTPTVYEKGAEVVRMYYTILGHEGFMKGMKLYFDRHDGQAVTCDDFRSAMADANEEDLTQFERWYSQAGTPILSATSFYDEKNQQYQITFKQETKQWSDIEADSTLLHIPIMFNLIGKTSGTELMKSQLLQLKTAEQTFTFSNVAEEPVPSILRGFSAPVVLKYNYSRDDLLHLMKYDSDPYISWDATQQLLTEAILAASNALKQTQPTGIIEYAVVEAFKQLLTKEDADRNLQSYCLQLPSVNTLVAQMDTVDPVSLQDARKFVRKFMANSLKAEFLQLYSKLSEEAAGHSPLDLSEKAVGRRRLQNQLLTYISLFEDGSGEKICEDHYNSAHTMTNKMGALIALSECEGDAFDRALSKFYTDAAGAPLLVDKWFALQAMSDRTDTMKRLNKLIKHVDFNEKNPNRLRSVIGEFANNLKHFHSANGEGYKIVEDAIVRADSYNSNIAASLTKKFSQWRKFDFERQKLMRETLETIAKMPNVSTQTLEIAAKCLKR